MSPRMACAGRPSRGRRVAHACVVGLLALIVPCGAATHARQHASLAALDCSRIGPGDVSDVLNRWPAPRIIALQGSVPFVTMEPFAAFLETMGYPRERLADPASGATTYSSFVDSRKLAGIVAWHYERDAAMPILVGHSQGGMVVIKVLHDLAGNEPIPVWNPARNEAEPRTTIVDPLTGSVVPVNRLELDYAAALATGSLPRLLLGQWGVLPILRDVPDSVRSFTGFAIPWDPIAGTGPEPQGFHATGRAQVRNVRLPSSYGHIGLPRVDHLASQPATRAWIDAYRPDAPEPLPRDADVSNIVHAAELWYGIKQAWCDAAKRFAAARAEGAR
jgi:hypothetical protein